MENETTARERRRDRAHQRRGKKKTEWRIPRQAVVIALVVLVALSAGAFATSTAVRRGVTPRYTDVWLIYPDDSVGFSNIFFPSEDPTVVSVAGPLFLEQDDIISASVFGGNLLQVEVLPDTSSEGNFFYNLYSIAYDGGRAGYGAEVHALNSPYITPNQLVPQVRAANFLAQVQSEYEQVIVAVAFPEDTQINATPGMQPYQTLTIGKWAVYYFDTSELSQSQVISFEYIPGSFTPEVISAHEIDRRR